mgnify:CR=1 FL=1
MRERERVDSSPSFPRRHKILFGLVVTIGVLLYAAFNVWVYQYSKGGNALSPKAIWQTVTSAGAGFQRLSPAKSSPVIPANAGIQGTITPTSRPTGPGQYACDEYGICNNYEDTKRVGCPKTYADPHCLNECGDKNIRCLKPK